MVVLVMARRGGRWTGQKDTGGREYTSAEYARVVAFMASLRGVTTYEAVSQATSIGGRTVRAALSAADGVEFVLALSDEKLGVAQSCDEAEHGTRRLRAQARTMVERAERRERWSAEHLPRWQQRMFD
jgi:hypothetical protein